MKKRTLGFILVLLLLFTTACSKTVTVVNEDGTSQKMKVKKVHEHCTRVGSMQGNAQADLNYEIYYTGEVLNKIESTEKVTSIDESILDQFEEAYKQIHAYYEGLKYYDAEVTRTSNSVTNKIVINYDKIDAEKLLEIEGEEDNIFEEGVPKVAKWKELTKKVGMTCEVVE